MTEKNHASVAKVAWRIYYIIALIIVVFLVLVVAQDNEERFFYGIMGTAVSHVFRPTDNFMNMLILKFTGVAPPETDTESKN